MQKRTREIIALVLLVMFGIAGIGAMTWYILLGHNWNEAASNIDDRIGNLEGYTVVLYEGATPTPAAQYASANAQPMLDEQSFGVLEARAGTEDGKPVALQQAIDIYKEKGATLVTVHVDDLRFYEDPVIVSRNGKRIAVFSAVGRRPDLIAYMVLRELERYEVDFTICLVDGDSAFDKGFAPVDVAICADSAHAGAGGRYIDGVYVVGVPYVGHAQVIIVSPSGFLSTKTLTEL